MLRVSASRTPSVNGEAVVAVGGSVSGIGGMDNIEWAQARIPCIASRV
jgi:hypothetical protein